MTIKKRLSISLYVSLGMFLLAFGAVFLGAMRYDHLQNGNRLVHSQVETWLKLNFEMSQYLKKGFEGILSGKRIQEESFSASTDEMIHLFIVLERISHQKAPYLSPEESEAYKKQLVVIRDQFGLIHAEIEKAVRLANNHQQKAAIDHIQVHISKAQLEQKFIRMIQEALQREEVQAKRINEQSQVLRMQLVYFALLLLLTCLVINAFLTNRVNRSVRNSIEFARRELLRGAHEIGSGKLDTEIQIETQDELSVISQAFNKMAKDLKVAWELVGQQQQQIVVSSKMAALGEMAGGIAHEINNPLAIIRNLSSQLVEIVNEKDFDLSLTKDMANEIDATTARIAKIVQGLRAFSRDASIDPMQKVHVGKLLESTLGFCSERFKNHQVDLRLKKFPPDLNFHGREVEISQVLLNLLNNSFDAVENLPEKWVETSVIDDDKFIEIQVTDSGKGIPVEIRDKLFQPFFTTKEIGKGTGLGLSISVGIIQGHGGELKVDPNCPNTRFVIRLPKEKTV